MGVDDLCGLQSRRKAVKNLLHGVGESGRGESFRSQHWVPDAASGMEFCGSADVLVDGLQLRKIFDDEFRNGSFLALLHPHKGKMIRVGVEGEGR